MPVYGHNSFSNDVRYVIHEAYVGKTATLLQVEDAINKVRVNCKKFQDINKSKEVQEVNRLIEKQFGMEVFSLMVDQEEAPNGYTIAIDTRFDVGLNNDISDFVIGDKKNGYRFKKDNGLGIICVLTLGLLKNPELTDAEIVSVILHEIGHNFAAAIYNEVKVANKKWTQEYYSYLLQNILNKKIRDKKISNNTSKQVIDKSKTKSKSTDGFKAGMSGTWEDVKMFLKEVFGKLGSGSKIAKLILLTVDKDQVNNDNKSKSIRRRDEVIADKFAGIYGYGPEQVSFLLKMDKYMTAGSRFVSKIPLIGKLKLANFYTNAKDFYIFDEHPQDIQRAYEEIKLLEAELEKSDLDPKLRKVIESQVKQIRDQIKEAIEISEDADIVAKVRAAFYAYINDKDPDAIPKDIEKEINDALDKALEKGGKY